MTRIEILWWWFWRLLAWRQHERPFERVGLPTAPARTPNGENREEAALVLVDRHGARQTLGVS